MERQRKSGGGSEARWWGWGWRGLAGDLSHTRALLQATIACVVIVLKAWRPGPEPPPVDCCVWGPRLSLSELFSSFLWLVRCLCSQGEGQFKKKKENITMALFMYDLSLYRHPFFFCFCLMFHWQLSVSCSDLKTGNAEEFTSSLILAMGSWPENTSSNFCLYWSSCVFPLQFLSPALQGFCRLFCSLSPLQAP